MIYDDVEKPTRVTSCSVCWAFANGKPVALFSMPNDFDTSKSVHIQQFRNVINSKGVDKH